ncbi:MAG: hypothetical protein BGN92_02555 [Sphingobacteriales bacterium 41-5]|nr:MAG: hypothetical protein BGN92_02555 [Sphingobacteriales bacterium 41-5]
MADYDTLKPSFKSGSILIFEFIVEVEGKKNQAFCNFENSEKMQWHRFFSQDTLPCVLSVIFVFIMVKLLKTSIFIQTNIYAHINQP